MDGMLTFLEEYSDALIVVFTALTTVATFLIWRVTRKQTEISSKQTEYASKQTEYASKQAEYANLMAIAAEQPIITVNYTIDNLQDYTRRNDFGFVLGNREEVSILVIQVSNIGKGSAYNLRN